MGELERSLGPVETTLMGVGVILGAGIYTLVGKAALLAGDVVWVSFLLAAAVAGLTGLSYAELSSYIPRAGGEYHYAQRAFGDLVAFLTTWLLLAGLAIASAAVALGFGGYFDALVPVGTLGPAMMICAACAALLSWGIKQSAAFAVACTVLELLGLIAVLVVGLPEIGSVDLLSMPHGPTGILSAAALIFFAFIGFEEIVQLAEEVREPERNLPRVILSTIAITTVLYVLVAIAATSVLGWEALGATDAPLAAVIEARAGWNASAAMAVIALFSTANTVLILLLSASRLLYGMAEDGALPRVLATVGGRGTPWIATLCVTAAAMIVAATFRTIEDVANLTNAALFVTFVVINLSVVALRLREPDAPRPFRVPLSIAGVPLLPLLGTLSAFVMIWGMGVEVLAWGAGLLGIGLAVRVAMRSVQGS